jgi:hypothetical protein
MAFFPSFVKKHLAVARLNHRKIKNNFIVFGVRCQYDGHQIRKNQYKIWLNKGL